MNWVRVDLHLHPGVERFTLPSTVDVDTDRTCEKSSEEYIKKMEDAQIKIGTVTDYNGVKRQLFIAAHNATIPVPGDSELIRVLEAENERCIIKNRGSIDREDIEADVKNIMEGGEEAFRIRAETYGGV